jgi:hypothetical protein
MWGIVKKGDSATPKEISFANSQFKDVLKLVGLAAWYALPIPGNTLLIITTEKILNKVGMSILPDKIRNKVFNERNPREKGVAEGWSDYDDNQYSLTDSTGKELTLLRGNTPEEAIERAKQLIGSNEKLLATFGLVKLTPRPHYIVRNAKRQGVAEGKSLPSMADIDKQFYELESQISDLEAKGVEVGKEHPLSKKWQQLVSMKQRILRKNLKKGVAEGYIDSLNANLLTELEKLDKLSEQDLIIGRGTLTSRPRDLVSRHSDHEISMAKNELYQASKNALEIYNMIKDRGEGSGLDAWVQSKITKAEDYLNTVRKYLEGKQLESLDGVSQGTKMFAEDEVDENIWDNIRKRQKSGKPPRKPGQKGAPSEKDWNIARATSKKTESAGDSSIEDRNQLIKKLATELDLGTAELNLLTTQELKDLCTDTELNECCGRCGGRALSNLIIAEKVDACYRKVKSRYKVWPSAYASGALVKCRKVGAKNWGNKSKK